MAEQSRLEQEGINYRQTRVLNKDRYQRDLNEYGAGHPDAMSDGDVRGKDVEDSVYTYLVPNKNESKTSYKETVRTDAGGNSVDINKRKGDSLINMYSDNAQYGIDSIDMSQNIAEGQIEIAW